MVEETRLVDSATLRRKAYVDVGREAFLRVGFGATTMSSIAARVGGSKTTLWNYFPSKEDLFAAIVDDIVEVHAKALSIDLPEDDPVCDVLVRFANALLVSLLSSDVIALHRLVAGEAERFPHLAQLFYVRGPERGRNRLAAFLQAKMTRRELRVGDPQLAAMQLFGLCQCGVFHRVFFGMLDCPPQADFWDDAALAVESFYLAWRPGALSI